MGLNIGVNVNADVSKLQALDRQMKQLKATYDALAKSAKVAGSSFGGSLPSMGGQMPLAGAVVPPSGFALMSSANPHAGLAGSKLPPVMWGASYRAQLHNMMPGQIAHQSGAQAALTQLSNQQRSMVGSGTYTSTGMTGLTGQLKLLTTSIDNLTKILQHPVATPSSTSNAALNMNPYVSLQSESVALQAMNPIASVSYPKRVQAKMTAAQNRVANPTQPAQSSLLHKFGQVAYRMAGGSYLGEMAGGAATDALGIGGSLAGIGMTAGIGALIGAGMWGVHKIGQGYQTYLQTANPLSNLYHSVMPGSSFGSFYNSIINQGNSVGASNVMKAQVAQILASTGGAGALGSVGSVFQGAVGLGYGVNGATTLASQLASLQQLGLTNGASASATNAQAMMMVGNASVMGGMQGRTSQLIDAMTSLTQSLDQQRSTPPNMSALLGMMTTLSSSGLQAFQGQRGANKLATFNSALTNPGGGTAGQLLMFQALQNGTGLSPYGVQYLAQQGLTGSYGGQTNLQRVLTYFTKEFPALNGIQKTGMPSNPQTQMALAQVSSVLGMSMPQTQTFLHQFMPNGKFSMANMNAEQNWWSNTVGGTPSATWTVAGAQLYNAHSYSGLASVAKIMQSNGLSLNSTENKQLNSLKGIPGPYTPSEQSTINSLRTEMGKQMLQNPLMTSMDSLTKAMNQNQNAWTTIAKNIVPIATDLNKIAGAIPSAPGGSATAKNRTPAVSRFGPGAWGNTSYDFTGHSSVTSQLANMAFAVAMNNTVFGSNNGYTNMSYTPGNGLSGWSNTPGAGVSSLGLSGNVSSFVSKMMPYAKKDAAKTGLPYQMLLGQWGLESGWGTSYAAKTNNNLAGIGVYPSEGFYAGKDSSYAGFNSLSAFANGYASFLTGNSNYKKLLSAAHNGASMQTLTGLLGASGYAQDPQYASKVLAAIQEVTQAIKDASSGGASSGLSQWLASQSGTNTA